LVPPLFGKMSSIPGLLLLSAVTKAAEIPSANPLPRRVALVAPWAECAVVPLWRGLLGRSKVLESLFVFLGLSFFSSLWPRLAPSPRFHLLPHGFLNTLRTSPGAHSAEMGSDIAPRNVGFHELPHPGAAFRTVEMEEGLGEGRLPEADGPGFRRTRGTHWSNSGAHRERLLQSFGQKPCETCSVDAVIFACRVRRMGTRSAENIRRWARGEGVCFQPRSRLTTQVSPHATSPCNIFC
jgi:hypothetical protein